MAMFIQNGPVMHEQRVAELRLDVVAVGLGQLQAQRHSSLGASGRMPVNTSGGQTFSVRRSALGFTWGYRVNGGLRPSAAA